MDNFSVIIPTIWKGPWIYELLTNFCNNQYIDDIILINNDLNNTKEIPDSDKIRIITPKENLFVNPSWNLGVSLAKNYNVIISNDDILFNVDAYIDYLRSLNDLKPYGIIGVNSDNYTLDGDEDITLNHHGDVHNTGGWACLFAFHVQNWIPIPETIKIYYGDNFLHMVCRPILELRGIKIKTLMSSSANTEIDWVKNVTDNDSIEWFNIFKQKRIEKINLSIGILAWKSGQTLVETLYSYYENGLLELVNDVTILFQEFSEQDKEIADHFNIPYIGLSENIGIGKAFLMLTENAKSENVMVLEHDWQLIENKNLTQARLKSGIELLNSGISVVRYRHRTNPGNPHFSFRHKGNELNYYDPEIGCTSPHLLDSIHWLNPDEEFPDKITKQGEYFVTTARWGNWTNNPCMYKKDFYLDVVTDFAGDGISLEGNISKWWATQTYKVAHGEGLFKHNDWRKYGK